MSSCPEWMLSCVQMACLDFARTAPALAAALEAAASGDLSARLRGAAGTIF